MGGSEEAIPRHSGPATSCMRSSRVVKQEAVIRWLRGWLSPRRKRLSCPERRPSFPNTHAPVLGDVCASRTGVRVGPRSAPLFRSQDTSVPLRAAWVRLPEPFGSILGVVCASRTGVRVPSRADWGTTIPRHGCPATSGMGARLAAKRQAVLRRLMGWQSRGHGVLSFPERQPSVPNTHVPILGDVCASRTGVRVGPRSSPLWRWQDTSVPPRAAWVWVPEETLSDPGRRV